MKILAIGDRSRADELFERLKGIEAELEYSDGDEDDFKEFDIIFDLNFDDDPENLAAYAQLKDKPVFVSAVKHQLAESMYISPEKIRCLFVGMNSLQTFINREKWELSLLHKPQEEKVREVLSKLGVEAEFVEDRVGMVTPRILMMIINEACYTLQEGTAGIEDIDQGMKLGTNYPMGPFEWADKIGISDVYETLAALYQDTGEERYKICSLLKTKYLRNQAFYPKA
jgi:3-hydroxybutyryl-CoA dehydrogenase